MHKCSMGVQRVQHAHLLKQEHARLVRYLRRSRPEFALAVLLLLYAALNTLLYLQIVIWLVVRLLPPAC